jgi:hypothetical protein
MSENEITDREVDVTLIDLGIVLGQAQAFGLVAGRCSAAQAEGIKRLRDQKLYQRCVARWDDFCVQYLKISRREADRTIQIWEEFGPSYFELSQLTRVSPETFRAIAPAVQDGALHYQGEVIELHPENASKVAAAVADLRRSLPKKAKPDARLLDLGRMIADMDRDLKRSERLLDLDKCCTLLIAEFEEASREEAGRENWPLFVSSLTRMRSELGRIALASGLA